ncbi:MAG: ABC transporter ATP-binding protein [Bacteroidales bacterium]
MGNSPILSISNLSKRLKNIKSVSNLSLSVYPSDIYGFLGPNGSGKSTTIRLILTLLNPDEGEINVFGLPLKSNRIKILKQLGAFIEKPDFYEYLSAYKNLELLSKYTEPGKNSKRINEVLELVGLSERSSGKVKTFSKGMKQRLGIAQALLHDPKLIVLDEPASGLDPTGMRDIRNLIKYLNQEEGKTIILSSHNLQEIESIANRMIIINDGKKVVEGEVEKLLFEHHYYTSFHLNNPEKAEAQLKESPFEIEKIEHKNNILRIFCHRSEISKINKYLVEKGFDIETIKMENSLEDYFLTLM